MKSQCTHQKKSGIRILLLTVFFFLSSCLSAQIFDTLQTANKTLFLSELIKQRQLDDALYLLRNYKESELVDSLKILEAKILLELRRENEAAVLMDRYLSIKSESSSHRCSAQLILNHSRIMAGKYDSLTEPSCHDHLLHSEEWRLQLLTSLIFRNKFDDFEMVFQSAKCTDPVLSVAEFALYIQKEQMQRRPVKHSFLAGLFSAIIPGTGKLYSGKPREAIYSFLPVVLNLAQAYEGYYFENTKSPHLYVFGAVGTVFYASNIYGSTKAAKRKNNETYFRIKSNIEFEIAKLIKYY